MGGQVFTFESESKVSVLSAVLSIGDFQLLHENAEDLTVATALS